MEDKIVNVQKNRQVEEDSLDSLRKGKDTAEHHPSDFLDSKSTKRVRRIKGEHTLILNITQSPSRACCLQKSSLQSGRGLDYWIPKHIVSLDERYLRQCLNLIHIHAFKTSPCNISLDLSSSKIGILSDSFDNFTTGRNSSLSLSRLVSQCPSAGGTGNVVINPAGQWIVGFFAGSRTTKNLLQSPSSRRLGTLASDTSSPMARSVDFREKKHSDYTSFLVSHKLENDILAQRNQGHGFKASHKRLDSLSSTFSTNSDLSSSPSAFGMGNTSKGMLQCTWKADFPYFVFSVDDKKDHYSANLMQAGSAGDKASDYTYLFHLKSHGQKEHRVNNEESYLVGKMQVHATFALCPTNNMKIMETECVLFVGDENNMVEVQTSNGKLSKNKKLLKVVKVFGTGHSIRHRTPSSSGGACALFESNSKEPFQDSGSDLNAVGKVNILESTLPPNLELAAIIVKQYLHDSHQKAEVGGWGLKFLNKIGVKQTSVSRDTSLPTESSRNSGDCSTSVDILVPAGVHGGPQTRNGGPSSLIERWRSGGHCDCGGWDIGCPLKVFHTKITNEDLLPRVDSQGHCKSFVLSSQDLHSNLSWSHPRGSELKPPYFKMVNINEGLYYIHFQSTLSPLQCFSIAVAILHIHSRQFWPKNVQSLK
ncbi:Protein of unknown function DUF3527 [Dillenia turbinata]|uniref:Uncharacterized protein n=1 Tax=Dillenia turbinata TaxID=194707 RepID=A0AAN8VLT2_9MAGN